MSDLNVRLPSAVGSIVALFLMLATACGGPSLGESCSPVKKNTCGSDLLCAFNEDFPVPACTAGCSALKTCPDDGLCTSLPSGDWCLKACSKDSDCRAGFLCSNLQGKRPVCVAQVVSNPPPLSVCEAPTLISGGMSGPSSPPSCRPPVATPSFRPAQQVQTQTLQTHPVDTFVPFTVPTGTFGLSIVVQAVTAPNMLVSQSKIIPNVVVPITLVGPNGSVVFDFDVTPTKDLSANVVAYDSLSAAVATMTLPNTSAMLKQVETSQGLPPGPWKVKVDDFAHTLDAGTTTQYDLTVVTNQRSPAAVPASADVAIYLATGIGITSANAPNDAHVQRMVSTFVKLYARAGVCVRNITFYDLPAWAQQAYSELVPAKEGPEFADPCDELHQMFMLSRPGNTLNYFFVDTIAAADGHTVGLDGTIPGPSGFGGTVQSGAAVSATDLLQGSCTTPQANYALCGADKTAYIMAHEGGHFLGLYHTSDANGVSFDPLMDTPSCKCDLCIGGSERFRCAISANASSPVTVDDTSCSQKNVACGGANNLMFWLVTDNSLGELTDEQGKVMRSNPATY